MNLFGAGRLGSVQLCVLLTFACDAGPSVAGRWISDAEQTAAAMRKFVPPGAEARLAQETGAAWTVAFEFGADGSFARTMVLPVLSKRESGRWRQDGTKVTMEITHRDGQLLASPKSETATIEGSLLRYGPENGPTFVLERSPK